MTTELLWWLVGGEVWHDDWTLTLEREDVGEEGEIDVVGNGWDFYIYQEGARGDCYWNGDRGDGHTKPWRYINILKFRSWR